MNTIILIRNRAINSARRILTSSSNSSIFRPPLLPHANDFLQPRLNLNHTNNHNPFRILGFQGFNVQCFSTSVETRVNENNFERIYIQGGVNVKPLVVESVVVKEEEESHVEKQAWKLLKDAVVTYCGNPVGTVAANDPGDKLPLNYDQVFIRDFVPSALAFLLKGDTEIVKYFLLHTLQLQVIYIAPSKLPNPSIQSLLYKGRFEFIY